MNLSKPRSEAPSTAETYLLAPEQIELSNMQDQNDPESSYSTPKTHTWIALRGFMMFHMPAIAVTLALLGLYIKQVQWEPSHPTSEELGVLQFAAKAHEALIFISLAEAMLHRIRYCLTRDEGLQVGFLASPHYIIAPFGYLFSHEFWNTVLKPATRRSSHTITISLFLLLTLVGIGAGPFSAIVLIPRQTWWAVDNTTEIGYQNQGIYVFTDDFYVMNYEGNPKDSTKILSLGPLQLKILPGPETLTNLTNLGLELEDALERKPYIPQMSNLSYIRPERSYVGLPISLTTTDPSPSSSQSYGTAFATAPIGFSVEPLWNSRKYTQQKDRNFPSILKAQPKRTDNTPAEKFRQPLVAVHCNESLEEEKSHTPIGGDVVRFNFFGSSFHKENFSFELSLDGKELGPLQTAGKAYHLPLTVFPDLQDKVPVPITAAVILRHYPDNVFEYRYWSTTLCLIQARWVEADVWMDLKEPHTFVQLETSFSDVAGFMSETSTHENVIKMGPEWLETAYDIPNDRNDTRSASALAYMMKYAPYSPPTRIPAFLSVFLVDFLTSVGGMVYSSSTPTFTGIEGFPPSSNLRMVDVIYYQHRYGYKFQGSVSIPLAFTLLFVQVIIAIVHTALLIHKSPPHGRACGTLGETVALALVSKTTGKYGYIEENINNSQVWSMRVAVKGSNDEQGHEMVALI
ncbi:unnamed protein product [Clonostachys solani]|uniref:Uncharacterized protein n=1 Tax=Clonostachys solani TaxID=160281 RepID=A0A9N9YXN5_9HYPO|nr:unnamed protein product [Clonostachys solani]